MTGSFLEGNPWRTGNNYLAILPDPDTVIRIQEFRRLLFAATGNASFRIFLPIMILGVAGNEDTFGDEVAKKRLKRAIEKCGASLYIRIVKPVIYAGSFFLEILKSPCLLRLQEDQDNQPFPGEEDFPIPKYQGFFLGYLKGSLEREYPERELEKIKRIFKEESGLEKREVKKFSLINISMSFDELEDLSSYNWEYTILEGFRIKNIKNYS